MWSSGEAILLRHVLGPRVLTAIPQRVIADDAASTATWIEPGTRIAYPLGLAPDGSLLDPDTWTVELRDWFGRGCLDLTPAGRAHMIRHFLGRRRRLRRVVRQSAGSGAPAPGWVRYDRSSARPLGRGRHLEQAVALGMFSRAKADAARVEAERVLEDWPFPTGWEEWRPPPEWPLPPLPAGWDIV